MKINAIGNQMCYTKQNFKSQPYKNHIDIKFSESDMEYGSMIGGLSGFLLSGLQLNKMNEKNLFKAGLISAAMVSVAMFATMGVITFVKILKNLNSNQK